MMTKTTENSLLDSASIQQCKQLAENADLQGKRAKALLELNNGESNSVAAEKSGLTTGQVSYLLGRFKKTGMALFDAKVVKKAVVKKAAVKKAVVKKAVTKKAAPKKATPVVEEPVIADDVDKQLTSEPATTGDKKKKKKDKKSSKKDKAKKDSNKNKKNKKGKKKKSKKNKK